jgi:putative membrane protein
MKLVRVLLLLLGVVLLGVLVARNDPAEIFASMGRLSWRLGILVCFPFSLVTIFDTLGWRFAFGHDRVRFGTLLGARLAGEAFNLTTPTAALGGEAVKTWLLRGHAPLDETLSSVIAAKTTILIAQGIFFTLGIALAGLSVLPDSPLLRGMLWLLLLEILALAGFVVAQTQGLFGWGQRLLQQFNLRPPGSGETLRRVDDGLASFYRRQPRRLVLSIGFHLIAWVLGSVEAYLALRFLGVDVSLTTATVIEAFGTAVRFATFMVPASLGVLEGGYVVTFSALGLASSTGVSFGLVRRVREFVWVGAGLIVFAVMRVKPSGRDFASPTSP